MTIPNYMPLEELKENAVKAIEHYRLNGTISASAIRRAGNRLSSYVDQWFDFLNKPWPVHSHDSFTSQDHPLLLSGMLPVLAPTLFPTLDCFFGPGWQQEVKEWFTGSNAIAAEHSQQQAELRKNSLLSCHVLPLEMLAGAMLMVADQIDTDAANIPTDTKQKCLALLPERACRKRTIATELLSGRKISFESISTIGIQPNMPPSERGTAKQLEEILRLWTKMPVEFLVDGERITSKDRGKFKRGCRVQVVARD